jgi:hypothetical protein
MCNHSEDIFAGLESDDCEAGASSVVQDMRGQLTDVRSALQFMRAGKACITLRSKKTEARYTYRLTQSEDGNAIFVGLLNGPDNSTDYKYLGRIAREIFWAGRKVPRPGDITADAPASRAFAWTWKKLVQGTLPEQLEIWHEGACGRCGRKLTVPASIARGFGPECAGKVGF